MYVSGQHDRMLHKLPNTKLYKTLKQLKIDTEINLIWIMKQLKNILLIFLLKQNTFVHFEPSFACSIMFLSIIKSTILRVRKIKHLTKTSILERLSSQSWVVAAFKVFLHCIKKPYKKSEHQFWWVKF